MEQITTCITWASIGNSKPENVDHSFTGLPKAGTECQAFLAENCKSLPIVCLLFTKQYIIYRMMCFVNKGLERII